MRITATGREPLPLTAWSSLRVFFWYFGTQLVVGGILGFLLGIRNGLGGEEAAEQMADATTQYLIPFAVIGMVVAALVMFRKAKQRFPGGSWPTILAALGWRQAPRRDIVIGVPGCCPGSCDEASADDADPGHRRRRLCRFGLGRALPRGRA